VRAGTIKALAIASPERNAQVAEIPTTDEAGAPGLHMSLWYGFWAPAGTPAPVIAKLSAAVQDALADPEVRSRLTGLGMEIPPREQQNPESLAAQQKADIEKWWPIIRAAGIKAQ
jgi:tripartite-type tricarboxylate transporter receptor subunit TctC